MTNGSKDDRAKPPATSAQPERRTGTRARVAIPVMCRYESVLDFVETQSMNISKTGMFIATDLAPPVGAKIQFTFNLGDGWTLLHGTAEVTRVVSTALVNGIGIRFLDIDDANRALIDRIVAVNSEEGRNSTLNFDFARPATVATLPVVVDTPVQFDGRSLRLVLGPSTVAHFTQSPLLNVRSGGFFVPATEDVPLGTIFQVQIVDGAGSPLVSGKGKVVAKQDVRVGIRLTDVDKDSLTRLRVEVEKFGSSK